MEYKIKGTVMQAATIRLERGEAIFTEKGGMAWMYGDIDMDTNTRGGLLASLGRTVAGESLFMTTYTCRGEQALLTFTPEAPGNVLAVELGVGESVICQRDTFMCAENTVDVSIHFRRKLGSAIFGGEGFILQNITGPGTVFLEIPGEVHEATLNPGMTVRVDPGHIAAFEPTVDFDIARVKGLSNVLFSGEGVFLATLTGPGRIWLQTMPLVHLAHKLYQYMPKKNT
jgi:uncharacterized protein (TIGR00266 family)